MNPTTTTRRRREGRITPTRSASLPALYSTPSSSSFIVPKETKTKRSTSLDLNDDFLLDNDSDNDSAAGGGDIFGQDGWSALDQSIILQYHFDFNEVSIDDDYGREDAVEDNERPPTITDSPNKLSVTERKQVEDVAWDEEEGHRYRDYYSNIKSNCTYNDKCNNNSSMNCLHFGEESQKSCTLTERTSSLSGSEFSLSYDGSTSFSRQHTVHEEVGEEEEESEWRRDHDDDLSPASPPTKSSLERYSNNVSRYEGHASTPTTTMTTPAPSSLLTTSHNLPPQGGGYDEQQGHCLYDDQSENEYDIIEVAPGISLPLKGSNETLEAIYDGRVTIARCCCCRLHLHCIDVADLVICPDCYVLSPIDISDSIAQNSYVDGDGGNSTCAVVVDEDQLRCQKYTCVGLGFKTKDILARLEEAQQD